jgi:uncharacterized protein (DUF58 family)
MASQPANTNQPSPAPGNGPLLDPDFIARLERLEINSRKIHASRQKGERRSKRRGESSEFADYRNYVSGDDLRHVDWNVYARLDRLFLKLFFEEEELNVSVLLDISGSMDTGDPLKARFARQLAAAVAYIGLCHQDRVSVYAYEDHITARIVGLRSRRTTGRLMRFLEELPAGGASQFTAAARQFAVGHTQKGVCLVISDFLDKGGYEEGLRYLLGRRMDVYVIQVLSPQELEPPFTGDLKLVDCEDDDIAEVTISRPLLDKYKAKLQAYCGSLRDFCTRRGVGYILTTTSQPIDTLVFDFLRRRGLLR